MTPSTLKPSLAHLAALAACFVLFAPPLTAQNSGRGFVKAQSGMTFGGTISKLSAGGGFGVRLTNYLDLFAEAGSMQDVMTPALQSELDASILAISSQFGVPVELSARIPSKYALFGSRITVPLRSVLTPFFEIGAGGASLSLDLRSNPGGLVHSAVFRDQFSAPIDSHFMLFATAGTHLAVTRRFGFDFAYRYFRISTDAPGVSGSQVFVGIVYRF